MIKTVLAYIYIYSVGRLNSVIASTWCLAHSRPRSSRAVTPAGRGERRAFTSRCSPQRSSHNSTRIAFGLINAHAHYGRTPTAHAHYVRRPSPPRFFLRTDATLSISGSSRKHQQLVTLPSLSDNDRNPSFLGRPTASLVPARQGRRSPETGRYV